MSTYYDLGTYSRPVATQSADAQLWFDRGLMWTYDYNFEAAVDCFQKAAALDPACVMACWGIAYGVERNGGPMPDLTSFSIFLTAAVILAVTPGPGIFYVLTRSIKGGRSEGISSTFGTAIGGLFHVAAAALGLSAILATSAVAFSVIKYAGAAYLIYLGIRLLINRDGFEMPSEPYRRNSQDAFRQGIITEMLNPKTALFFLAFIPQFINPEGVVVFQFILLGGISVLLNSTADLIVAFFAGPLGSYLTKNVKLRQGQQLFSGVAFIALGTYVAVIDNK